MRHQAKSLTLWEYAVVNTDSGSIHDLNKYGKEGWEVVCKLDEVVISHPNGKQIQWLVKRMLEL